VVGVPSLLGRLRKLAHFSRVFEETGADAALAPRSSTTGVTWGGQEHLQPDYSVRR
jgi:hypothetical protein